MACACMVNEALGYLRKQSSANQEIVVEELPDMVDGDDDTMEQIPQSVIDAVYKRIAGRLSHRF